MNITHFFHSMIAILGEMAPYILLGFIIAGLLHVFLTPERMTKHLAGRGWKPVVKAALFGIPLPLCSCGVLPTAVALRRSGASKGATTSFLIATPQTGVDSIAATASLMGLPFAIIRPIAALVGAFVGGMAVGRSDMDETGSGNHVYSAALSSERNERSFIRRLGEALRYGLVDMVGNIGKWLVIGLVVAALITVLVPDSFFIGLNRYPLLAMLGMVVVAVPMYICATGSIPIALSLMLKGLSPGTAFVMLMAGPAANFASVMILNKNMGAKASAVYVATVALTAIAFGLVIDLLLPASWFIPTGAVAVSAHCAPDLSIFQIACAAILCVSLLYSALRPGHGHTHSHEIHDLDNKDMAKKVYQIKGMACNHCRATVEKQLTLLPGVEGVTVSLSDGTATVEGNVAPEAVKAAVEAAGFECALG